MAGNPYLVDPQEAGFGPPNMAAQLFGMISGLPNAYQQGSENQFKRGQQARTEELQKPVLGPNGEPVTDYTTLFREYMKRTGPTPELLAVAQGQEADSAIGGGIFGGGGGGGGKPPYSPSNPNLTPDNRTPRWLQPQGQRSEAPPQGPAGEDTRHMNLRQLAINADIDPDSPDFKQAFPGVKIDREFSSPEQANSYAAKVKQFSELKATGAARLAEMQGGTAGLGPSSAGQGTMYMPGPGMQGAPPTQMAQAAPVAQQAPSDAEARAQAFDAEAARREQILIQRGRAASPAAKEGALESIRNLREQAKTLRANEAAIAKETDPRVRQAKGLEKGQEGTIKQGEALANSINNSARDFQQGLAPHLDLMRGIMNDPNLATGTGVDFKVAWNKLRSDPNFRGLPGYDPNAALPNEGLRKVLAASVLNQTASLKDEAAALGGSAGRIFQQQVQLAIDASQNDSNTLPALRYLTEVQSRMGQHQLKVQELLNNYNGQFGKGIPDNNFNQVLAQYNAAHPIFTKSEIDDHKLIAPPVAPNTNDRAKVKAWADHNGLKAGDPFIAPNGKMAPWQPLRIEINKPAPPVSSVDRT